MLDDEEASRILFKAIWKHMDLLEKGYGISVDRDNGEVRIIPPDDSAAIFERLKQPATTDEDLEVAKSMGIRLD